MHMPTKLKPKFDCYFGQHKGTLMLRLWQSGRELFHSNVLAYLIETANDKTTSQSAQNSGQQLLNYLSGEEGWNDWAEYHIGVLREQWSMDLIIIAIKKAAFSEPNGLCQASTSVPLTRQMIGKRPSAWQKLPDDAWRLIIIENKFKSLPDADQLARYDRKLNGLVPRCGRNESKIKLGDLYWLWCKSQGDESDEDDIDEDENKNSVLEEKWKPNRRVSGSLLKGYLQPTKTSIVMGEWAQRDYSGITKILQPLLPSPSGTLEEKFLASYKEICSSATQFHADLNGHLISRPFSSVDTYRDSADNFGLADYVDKWRYSFLQQAVIEALATVFGENLLKEKFCEKVPHGKKYMPTERCLGVVKGPVVSAFLETYAGFSRGTGMVGVALLPYCSASNVPLPFFVTIQLQGNQLRLGYEAAGEPDKNRETAAIFINKLLNYWSDICKAGGLPWNCVDVAGNGLGSFKQTTKMLTKASEDQCEWNRVKEAGCMLHVTSSMWGKPDKSPLPWVGKKKLEIAMEIAGYVRCVFDFLQNDHCKNVKGN